MKCSPFGVHDNQSKSVIWTKLEWLVLKNHFGLLFPKLGLSLVPIMAFEKKIFWKIAFNVAIATNYIH